MLLAGCALLAFVGWPFLQSVFVSAHGMTDTGHRVFKFEVLLGFIASYVLTRLKSPVFRVFGWIAFVPYASIAAVMLWAVVGVAMGRT
jgi:hypothetical protein